MMNEKLKAVIWSILIMTSLVTCGNSKESIVERQSSQIEPVFVIYNDVKFYSDGDSINEKQKLNYLDSLVTISKEINSKGRIKVKLQSGAEGWIEDKFISNIPDTWRKYQLKDGFYFYAPQDEIFNFRKVEKGELYQYQYRSNYFKINLQIDFQSDYKGALEATLFEIKSQIASGDDKNLNWSKEFILNNYQINYAITTFDPENYINESFNFVKIEDIKTKKYFTLITAYHPSISLEKLLIQRKILFSALQSLQ